MDRDDRESDLTNEMLYGNVTIKTSPRFITSKEHSELIKFLPSMSSRFTNVKKIKRCKVNGKLVEECNNIGKKSDNSLIYFEKFIGKILHILLIKEEFFFVLQIDKKIASKRSQYYFTENLDAPFFCLKKADMIFSKAITVENKDYFTIFPNNIECD